MPYGLRGMSLSRKNHGASWDTIFGADTQQVAEAKGSILAVHPVDDQGVWYSMLNEHGVVTKLTEKPDIPTATWLWSGCTRSRRLTF